MQEPYIFNGLISQSERVDVRLMAHHTLYFGDADTFGILITSWIMSAVYFFPNDPIRARRNIVSAPGPLSNLKIALKSSGENLINEPNCKEAFLLAVSIMVFHAYSPDAASTMIFLNAPLRRSNMRYIDY
jgi:hypothetical protein